MICVVGGAGHIGLSLVLVFTEQKLIVAVYDLNEFSLDLIRTCKIPFVEEGDEKLPS